MEKYNDKVRKYVIIVGKGIFMDKLKEILDNKELSDKLRNIIISLYDEVIRFYGMEKEDLILETIKQFKFVCVDDLEDKLVEVQNGKTSESGVGEKNVGLCMVTPVVKDRQIVDVERFILIENKINDDELISIILHELFFHGVKSMYQPYMSDNILMIGLNAQKYYFDDENNIINIERYVGHGLEEISTYYGQNKILTNLFDKDMIEKFVDEILFDIIDSFGKIMDDTSLGKIILDSQITKDISELEKRFEKVEDKRIWLTKDENRINWNDYNKLIDEFMKYHYIVVRMLPDDIDYGIKLTEYLQIYTRLNKLNMDILFAVLLLDSLEISKKRGKSRI